MTARPRDGIVAIVIAVFLFGGVALDTWGPDVSPARSVPADPAFDARAVFCPPSLDKPAGNLTVTAAARGGQAGDPIDVGFEPATDERVELAPETILELRPPTEDATGAADVVGYGGPVDATVVTSIDEPVSGVGGAACASGASTRWYFPEGNSTVTHDERLLIYNPFPDEAVVRVALLTPGGERTKAGLADVAVPAESSIDLAINDVVAEQQKVLGTAVTTVRGRVVAWRLSIVRPEEKPSGIQFTLGARSPDDTWYFPEGAVGVGYEERISIMNPGSEEATVEVTLVTGSRALPATGATEVPVPPRSTVAVVLEESALPGESGGVGAVVRSLNRVPVVVERTVFYSTEDVEGVASEIGSATPARRWLLGPATSRPATDSAVLLNPTTQEARVTLTLLGASGRALRPRPLRNLKLDGSERRRIPLATFSDGEPYAVLVQSTAAVVAERVSYSAGARDVSSLMGIPLK